MYLYTYSKSEKKEVKCLCQTFKYIYFPLCTFTAHLKAQSALPELTKYPLAHMYTLFSRRRILRVINVCGTLDFSVTNGE